MAALIVCANIKRVWGPEAKRRVNAVAYEKLLNEIYAAVSLKYLWKEYQPHFVKSESPDWISFCTQRTRMTLMRAHCLNI